MKLQLLLVPILLAATPAIADMGCGRPSLDAQPRCKTGCPCGNSCISCSKTCRVGVGSARAAEPAPSAERRPVVPVAKPGDTSVYTGAWMASSANRFYFRASCPIGTLLAAGDRVRMPDSIAAEAVGFRRLVMPKC